MLTLGTLFASVMVTAMRLCDAVTDPLIGALMDRTNGKFGKFRPFMLIGNLIRDQLLKVRDWNFGSALSMVLVLLTAGIYAVYRKCGGKDLGVF